ncbi:uncharacterized protein LOC141667573 [Apium graveolens]|uniref:uncharacterized protein LOC141667573 n=1 Tax=Apium graveolens TaxID=4045 RepID=UPI003D79230D
MGNPIVFFDIKIGGAPAGRIEFELYADTCPKTAENFRAFCTGEKGIGSFGSALHYKGTEIDVIYPYGYMRGGRISKGKYPEVESVYGGEIESAFSDKKNDRPGMLTMYPAQTGLALTFFTITAKAINELSSQYLVFGHAVNGLDVLNAVYSAGTITWPRKQVIIADCGQIINGMSIIRESIKTEVLEIGGILSGRIVIKLFHDTTPLTAATFHSLCTGGTAIGKTSGKALHFKGSTFHRVIPAVMCHGGDFSLEDGSGGEPILNADKFLSESFVDKHTRPGVLSMVNSGKGADGSQFYICTGKTDWLDGKHVVFG